MKLLHTSDLHLGLKIGEYSLIEDQQYVIDRIVDLALAHKVDGVIIAGDVYDKSIPSREAVSLFDGFLSKLYSAGIEAYVIYGNHDSAERIAFAGELVKGAGVYLSPVFSGDVTKIVREDEWGEVNIYLLPFVKPATVRRFFEEKEIDCHNDAVAACLGEIDLDSSLRNIIISHQFVTGASRSESEEITVGGADNVSSALYSSFDYAAMGHIHSPQCCGSPYVNYSGTPLKYSLSEASDDKSVTLIELREKGKVIIDRLPLKPLRDLKLIKGRYDELMAAEYYEGTTLREDYVGVVLTDEMDVPDAVERLRTVYKNILSLRYENSRSANEIGAVDSVDPINADPISLFGDFYKLRNGREMTEEQRTLIAGIIKEIWEDGNETY